MLQTKAIKSLIIALPVVTLMACSSGPSDAELEAERNRAAQEASQQAEESRAAEQARVKAESANQMQAAKDMMKKEREALESKQVVYFDFDRASVKSDFHAILDQHAAYLSKNPNQKVVIEGHCDSRGTPEYNIALGETRAQSVETYLLNAGVSSSQISVVSYGEEKPAVMGSSEYAFAQNRRGVIVYQ